VIFDLEGTTMPREARRGLGLILPVASAAVATAVLLVAAAIPRAGAPHFVESAPSILEQAFAKPPPTLDLMLPTDLALEVEPLRVDGIYGIRRPAPALRTFRMRGSNTIVIVAMVLAAPAIVKPANPPADTLWVHGVYAANYSVEATSLSAVRWTENGMTYEVAARSVLLRDLVALAEHVR
jgi:hypothetical protein